MPAKSCAASTHHDRSGVPLVCHEHGSTVSSTAVGALATAGACGARCQIDSCTTLIDHHKVMQIPPGDPLAVRGALLLIALGGTQRLFLRVQPRRLMARAIARVLSCTPCTCSQREQCVARLASGFAAHCAHK